MQISRKDLEEMEVRGILAPGQGEQLWQALRERGAGEPRFDLAHVLYYLGSLVVMGAMSYFMTLGWASFGGSGLAAVAGSYMGLFALAGRTYFAQPQTRVAGGLLWTLALTMVPLLIYGIQDILGIWPQEFPGTYRDFYVWVRGGWFWMEVGTLGTGMWLLRRVPFPFLLMPVSLALYFLSMDLVPLRYGQDFTWDQRLWFSIWFGLAMCLGAYGVDLKRLRHGGQDFAQWLYLFGATALWCGLSLLDSGNELQRLGYALLNLGLIFLSLLVDRGVFLVYGSLGFFGYLSYLSYTVFADSLFFPFVLSALGVALILAGVQYHKHEEHIKKTLRRHLPPGLAPWIPVAYREE